MRNHGRLMAALLGTVFLLGSAGGALAHGEEGQHMMKEQSQATQQMPAAESGMMMQGHDMMGQGMMGQGMMGQGMMGHGMMSHDMMGHGRMKMRGKMMGRGMMKMHGGGFPKLMSADDAKALMSHWLARHIGERVKIGAIEELGIFAFGVEVVTVDGSLVQRLAVDRRGHGIWRID